MTGLFFVFVMFAAIITMIVMIIKFGVHPFIALLSVSIVLGLFSNIPIADQNLSNGEVTNGLVSIICSGFSNTLTSVGLIIIMGIIIGKIMEETGATIKIADKIVNILGRSSPVMAIQMIGWLVSIPVFCDSGFVMLNPICKAIVKRINGTAIGVSVALAAGLFTSHVLIPPTTGPIIMANTLKLLDNWGLLMMLGVLCSIFPMIAAYIFASHIGKQSDSGNTADYYDEETEKKNLLKHYAELKKRYGELPGTLISIAPVLLPIILISVFSISHLVDTSKPVKDILYFIGDPIIAMFIGVIIAIYQLYSVKKIFKFSAICNNALKISGPIVFITAAGGILGKIISSSDAIFYISDHAEQLSSLGIFFPFILAAILKTAQGSSTVAIAVTSGIVAPLMMALGFTTDVQRALVCLAIGAGAMTVSHANDSYFWVVSNFSNMTVKQAYRTWTLTSLIMGIATIIEITLLNMLLVY